MDRLLNRFFAELLWMDWKFPVWAIVTTIALLLVFGWVTYYYLRLRRRG